MQLHHVTIIQTLAMYSINELVAIATAASVATYGVSADVVTLVTVLSTFINICSIRESIGQTDVGRSSKVGVPAEMTALAPHSSIFLPNFLKSACKSSSFPLPLQGRIQDFRIEGVLQATLTCEVLYCKITPTAHYA